MLAPGYPLDGDPFGHAVAEQVSQLAKLHELRVQSLVPLAVEHGRSRGVDVRSIDRLRIATIAARYALWRPELVWSLWANSMVGGLVARIFRASHVVSILGGEVARLDAIEYGGARTFKKRVRIRLILQSAQVVTVGSHWLKGQVPEAVVAPIGVRLEDIPQKSRAPRTGGALALAAVIDASPVKGARHIFAALSFLRARGVAVELTIFTLASEENRRRLLELGRAVAPWIHLAAPLSPRELYGRLGEFDVLVSASAHEAQGLAMIEAAMAELPVVATAVGVAPELASMGAARIAQPTAESLGSAILEAAAIPTYARARVAEAFGLEACTERFDRAFRAAAR